MIDLGTGNNNKINWAFNNKQELIDIIEVVYRGGRKGRGLVVSPKDCTPQGCATPSCSRAAQTPQSTDTEHRVSSRAAVSLRVRCAGGSAAERLLASLTVLLLKLVPPSV